jgi:hypothetical protein
MSLSRQLHLTEAELERIGNTRIDSNEVLEVVLSKQLSRPEVRPDCLATGFSAPEVDLAVGRA